MSKDGCQKIAAIHVTLKVAIIHILCDNLDNFNLYNVANLSEANSYGRLSSSDRENEIHCCVHVLHKFWSLHIVISHCFIAKKETEMYLKIIIYTAMHLQSHFTSTLSIY